MREATKPLNKIDNHFISTKGYVFKVRNGREIICNCNKDKYGRIVVQIEGKDYDLVNLLLEYFFPRANAQDEVFFSHDRAFRVPISGFRFKKNRPISGITLKEESRMSIYKCNIKAASANARTDSKITGYDVYNALIISGFKCTYCSDNLMSDLWHLDHFHPISRGGKNTPKNLAPACDICNKMKHTLDGYAFIRHCKKVIIHHSLGQEETFLNDHKENKLSSVLQQTQ